MDGDPSSPLFDAFSPKCATVDLVQPRSELEDSKKFFEFLVVVERDFNIISVIYQRNLMINLWNELDVESRVLLVSDDRFIAKLKDYASKLAPGVLDITPNKMDESSEALIKVWNSIDERNKLKLLKFLRTSKLAKDLVKSMNKVNVEGLKQGNNVRLTSSMTDIPLSSTVSKIIEEFEGVEITNPSLRLIFRQNLLEWSLLINLMS